MPRTLSCRCGHNWSTDDVANNLCPVCGSAALRETINMASAESTPDKAPGFSTIPTTIKPEIPGFEILDELGRGGMGVVYRAKQKSLGRIVALKMLLSGPMAGVDELARLRAEAESIARLQHPNIVHVYDIGEHNGWTFISLEYIDGGNLAKSLNRSRSPNESAELIETLARAVHAAHQRGVIHRDLKPANVLMSVDGIPKITDFGLAKRTDSEVGQTRSGAIIGTPCYMAPEQAEGKAKDVGPTTDVYALGAMLYELLTGKPPFHGDSAFGIMQRVVSENPIPPRNLQPGLPRELEAICLKCLHKEPARRFQTALALADELRKFRQTPIAVEPVRPKQSLADWLKQNRKPAWIIAASIVVIGAIMTSPRLWKQSVQVSELNDSTPMPPALIEEFQPAEPTRPTRPVWSFINIGHPGEKFDRIAFPSRMIGYVASRQAVYKTIDGGKTWKRIVNPSSGRVHVLQFQNDNIGWLATDALYQTTNGGASWKKIDFPASNMAAITALAMNPARQAVGAGNDRDGRLLLALAPVENGWQRVLESAGIGGLSDMAPFGRWHVGDMAFLDPSTAVAAVFNGGIDQGVLLVTRNAGVTWEVLFNSPDADLYRVRFFDSQRGWLVGSRGRFWATIDGGRNWQPANNVGNDGVTPSCLAFGKRCGIAPLWNGQVLITRDGMWEKHDLGEAGGYSMPSAAVVDDNCFFVLSADGKIAWLDVNAPP